MSPEEKLPLLTKPTLERLWKFSQDAMAAMTPLVARGFITTSAARELIDAQKKLADEITERGGYFGEFGAILWKG